MFSTKKQYLEDIYNLKTKNLEFSTTFNYSTLVLSIHSCLNIGNMLRSANLTGVDKFIIFGNKNYDRRSAMCSYQFNNVIRIQNGEQLKDKLEINDYIFDTNLFIETMNKYNLTPIFVEQDKTSFQLDNHLLYKLFKENKNENFCFIFGNEKYGIPKNLLETTELFKNSFIIQLKQINNINSYNVSNCYSIIMNRIFEYNLTIINEKYLLDS